MNNIFKTIYESATLLEDGRIVLDSKLSTHTFDAVEGKHCIWIPELELKIPWTYNGKIESRKQWELGINAAELLAQTFNDDQDGWDEHTLASIAEEYRILRMLAEYQMAPPTEGFVYVKNFISMYTRSVPHCDSMGMVGYHTKDANKLPGGKFSFELFEKMFTATSKIEASRRALGDLHKESNIVNGYLIDIRRTIWDMMRLGESLQCFSPLLPAGFHKPDPDELHDKIGRFGQFPYSRRRQNYQTYCMDGIYFKGPRDTVYRMEKMGVPKELKGKTVLDLGCQIGAMCAEAYMRGARHVTGIEHEKDYVECARDLARYNGHQINYMRMDLTDLSSIVSYVGAYYGSQPIDIVFLLSMYKHLGDVQFELLERLSWREAYVESNNCPDGYESGQARKMEEAMKKRIGWSVERLGLTTDRSPRCLWRIKK